MVSADVMLYSNRRRKNDDHSPMGWVAKPQSRNRSVEGFCNFWPFFVVELFVPLRGRKFPLP